MQVTPDTLAGYWESRASRLATEGSGLGAVCSYGMPWLYNKAIELSQIHALRPWINGLEGLEILEIGCGVGRWTERLAARNRVTAIDISPSMIRLTDERLRGKGLSCELRVGDVAELSLNREFDAVLSVTVLQHVPTSGPIERAFSNLRAHLRPGGRLIMLEAAPNTRVTRNDSAIFCARTASEYIRLVRDHGFELLAVRGVDPVPLKYRLLPLLKKWPVGLIKPLLLSTTALTLPLDLCLSPWVSATSWHKVIVARRIV